MKSGFFGKSTKTTTTSNPIPKTTTTTIITKTTPTSSNSSLITSPPLSLSQFNLYPKSNESTTLHWNFFPLETSITNPIGECLFYITIFSLELFKKTTWFSSSSSSGFSSSLPIISGDKLYELKEIQSKGNGLISLKEIESNTLIMYSRPLIIYDSTRLPPRSNLDSQFQYGLSQLKPSKQKDFLKLTNSLTKTEEIQNINYLGRIESNSFPIVQFSSDNLTYSAVFPTYSGEEGDGEGGYSSLNHSCFPNTIPNWNELEGRLEVRTTRKIKLGEELTSTYIMTMQKRRERRYELLVKYKFHCMCEWCSLSEEESVKKDEEREEVAKAFLKEWNP